MRPLQQVTEFMQLAILKPMMSKSESIELRTEYWRAAAGNSRHLILLMLMAGALLVVPIAVQAQNTSTYCIRCTEPEQTYQCAVTAPAQNADSALQLYCIVAIAKDLGHSSCGVRKTAQQACMGRVVTYRYDGPVLQNNSPYSSIVKSLTGPSPKAEEKAPDNGEPKTLVEFTSRTIKASQKGLANAGKATKDVVTNTGKSISSAAKTVNKKVGEAAKSTGSIISNAAKSTIRCIGSLFSDC